MEENKLKEFFLARFDEFFVQYLNAITDGSIYIDQYEVILYELLIDFRSADILPDGVSFWDVMHCIKF